MSRSMFGAKDTKTGRATLLASLAELKKEVANKQVPAASMVEAFEEMGNEDLSAYQPKSNRVDYEAMKNACNIIFAELKRNSEDALRAGFVLAASCPGLTFHRVPKGRQLGRLELAVGGNGRQLWDHICDYGASAGVEKFSMKWAVIYYREAFGVQYVRRAMTKGGEWSDDRVVQFCGPATPATVGMVHDSFNEILAGIGAIIAPLHLWDTCVDKTVKLRKPNVVKNIKFATKNFRLSHHIHQAHYDLLVSALSSYHSRGYSTKTELDAQMGLIKALIHPHIGTSQAKIFPVPNVSVMGHEDANATFKTCLEELDKIVEEFAQAK